MQAAQFPYHAAAGAVLDSGDYARLTEMALAAALTAQACSSARPRRARPASCTASAHAAIVEPSVSNMGYISTVLTPEQRAKAGPKNGAIASATVAVDLLGGVNVTIASAPAGQGHMTVCAQVVADALGLQPQQVVVNVEFDTAKDAWTVAAGNYRSRFAGAVAGTVHLAALQTARQAGADRRGPVRLQCRGGVFCRGPGLQRPAPRAPPALHPPGRAARTGHPPCCPKAWPRACARPRSGRPKR